MNKSIELAGSSYNSGQRLGCMALAVAGTVGLAAPATQANVPMQVSHGGPMPIAPHLSQTGPILHSGWQIPGLRNNSQTTQPSSNPFNTSQTVTHSAGAGHHLNASTLRGAATATATTAADLDLASANQNFSAGQLANFKSITIQVGDYKEVVLLNSKLTAAEVVAAQQIITTGKQTIQIGAQGTATGGSITLNKNLLSAIDNSVGGSLGSLTVPQGVKLVDAVSTLSLSGELANYGSILTAAASRGATDTISAGTILNATGGSIASYAGGGGLNGASSSLNAATSLTNNGSISSTGNLNITAPVVNNNFSSGSGAGAAPAPTITAQHNVNLNTQSINNEGSISALSGNINIASKNADLNLAGGNYLSKQLNLDAGTGNITVNVDEVTGVVNASGNCVHMDTSTPNLLLGSINALGDPLVANNGSDITITGTGFGPTNGADLTLVSTGNILGGKGNKGLDTSSKTGAGGNLTLVAGAAFTGDANTGVTVTGASTGGGIIDLSGTTAGTGAVTTIKTGGAAGQNSGDVTIVAFAGTSSGTGTINVSKTTIDTSAKTGGNAGDVTIIGTGQVMGLFTGINAGAITGNNILVTTGTPSAGAGVSYDSTGKNTSGSFTAGTPVDTNLTVGTIKATGDVSISAGQYVTVGAITSSPATATNTVTVSAGLQTLTISKPITGGTINLSSGINDVVLNAAIGTTATQQITISGNNLLCGSAGVIAGKNATLTATGDIGTESFSGKVQNFNSKVAAISLTSTGGEGHFKQTGDLLLETGAMAFNLDLLCTGNLTVPQGSTVGGSSADFTATKNMTVLGTLDIGSLTITTSGSMTVGSSTNTSAALSSPFLFINSSTMTNFGTVGSLASPGTLEVTVTGKGNAITNSGTFTGNSVFLTNKNTSATILNNAGGMIQGTFVTLNSSNVLTSGIINGGLSGAGGSIVVNSTGALNITGTDGSFTTGPFGSFTLQAGKDITVAGVAATDNPLSKLNQLTEFAVSTLGGYFTSPLQGISVATDPAGNGGNIRVFAYDLRYNGSALLTGPFIVDADGTGSKAATSAQSISFFLGAPANNNLVIGNGAGQYEFFAQGINSGTVQIFSFYNLTVNDPATNLLTSGKVTAQSPFLYTLILQGEKGVSINGNLSTLNGDGHYSDLQIITNNSKTPFDIGAPSATTNGIFGITTNSTQGLFGGNVTIDNAGGVKVETGAVLSAESSLASNFNTLTNFGTVSTPSMVIGSPSGSITINNSSIITTPTANLSIQVTSGGMTIFNNAGAEYDASGTLTFNSTLAFVSVNGPFVQTTMSHDIVFDAPKSFVTLGSNTSPTTISVAPDSNGNGGSISITATNLNIGTGGVSLVAQSTGTTNGGSVNVDLSGTKALTIGPVGTTGAQGLSIDVSSSAVGGNVGIINGGNITVTDASKIDLANTVSGTGSLGLTSSKGLLYISDFNNISSANLDLVSLTSGSTMPFLLSGAKVTGNGFGMSTGSLNANFVEIANAGSIDISSATIVGQTENLTTTKGSIICNAANPLVAQVSSTNAGGTINLTAQSITGAAGMLLQASSASGAGGSVNINLSGNKPLIVGPGGLQINVSNGNSTGGEIYIINGGNLTVDATAGNGLNLGGTTAFNAGQGADLYLSAKGLLFVNGTDSISSLGLHNVTFISNSKTTFELGGATSKGNGLSYTSGPSVFNADSVTVTNGGGSVDYTTGSISAHSMKLTATKGTIFLGSIGTLTPLQDSNSNGGTIYLNAQSLSYTGSLALDATGSAAGNGGNATLILTGTTPLTFGGNAAKAITADVSNGTGSGGSLSVSNGGNLNVDTSSGIAIGSGWAAGNGASVSFTSNGLTYVNQLSGFLALGLRGLTIGSSNKTPLLLSGARPGGNGIGDAALNLTADNLSFTNNGGAIINNTVSGINGSHSVSFTALTDVGQSTSPLVVSPTAALSINAGKTGNAYVTTTGTTTVSQASIGKLLQLNATGGNLTLGAPVKGEVVSAGTINVTFNDSVPSNTDLLTLNQVSATAGNLNVLSNAQELLVGNNAVVSANLGNITLQNKGTATSPLIQFNSFSVVHASGAASNKNQGNVTIVVGDPIPTTFTSGDLPSNVTVVTQPYPNGTVTFGAVGNLSGTITITDRTDVLSGIERFLHFNTAVATQINLADNVQITADPPPAIASGVTATPVSAIFQSSLAPAALTLQTNFSAGATVSNSIENSISAFRNSAVNSALGESLLNTAISTTLMSSGNSAALLTSTTDFNTEESLISAPSPLMSSSDMGQTVEKQKKASAANNDGKSERSLKGSISNLTHSKLNCGALLLVPDQNELVDTPYGTVKVAAGAVTLLVVTDKGLAVYNLHDNHKDSVVIDALGQTFSLTPGLNALLSHSPRQSFEELNPAPYVAYRNLRSGKRGEMSLHQAEYQITSLLRALPTMTKSMTVNDVKKQKAMANVVKTAAILMTVMPGGEPFTCRAGSPMTACAISAR
jgi:hypothetical protein